MKKSFGIQIADRLEPLLENPDSARKWITEHPSLSGGTRSVLLELLARGLLAAPITEL